MNLRSVSSFPGRITAAIALCCMPLFSLSQHPFFEEVAFTYQNRPVKTARILKDGAGWLWFGTDNGLFRYDGSTFKKIQCEDSLREENVSSLFQSSDGKIWVGFVNGTIACYFKKKFRLFRPEEGLPRVAITGFAETKNNTVWISTNGEGIYCFDQNQLFNINTDDGLNDNYVHAIHAPENADWVIAGSDQGLNECTIQGGKKNVRNLIPESELPDHIITSILQTGEELIVGTQDKGIFMVDVAERKMVIPHLGQNWEYGMVNKVIRVDDELWIATDEQGLILADALTGRMIFQLKNHAHFHHSKIRDLLSDQEGNAWLACTDGLVKSPGKKIRFLESVQGEKISFVHAILFDSKGNCWFTPDQGLVKMWQDSLGTVYTKNFKLTSPEKLIDIVTLYEDPYGFLWIGTMGGGVFQLNPETGAVRKITGNPALIDGSILTITGKGDDVWIGGFDGTAHCTIGIIRPDWAEIKFSPNMATDSLANSYVYCITTDKLNRTWIGTDGDGAFLYEDNRLKNLSPRGLAASTVYSILEDRDGNIWFNTQDHGVYKFDGHLFYNYSIQNGLSDVTVSSMIFDQAGNLLLVHKNGVDILNVKTNSFTYMKGSSLLSNMNPDLNSISGNEDGEVFIGTENFILQIYTRELQNRSAPATFLESIAVFQNEVADSVNSFPSDQNNFSFAYAGLWYSNPSLIQYQYKLEGFNDEWVNTTDKEINFPKLSPGTYTFRVRSSLNSDFTNASEASFHFIIRPPFWKTTWFQISSVLLAALFLYSFIRWRDRRIRKMDRLRKEAVEFQFETLKSQVNPHFLFNSFNTLVSIIEEDPKSAVGYVEKLSEFFRSIVAYRDKTLISLEEEVSLLKNYFYLQQKRYGDNLSISIDLDNRILEEFELPPLTLQMLVENAIKHNAISRETKMQIGLTAEGEKLAIQNNINPKMVTEKSSGMGLQNITSRFKLLTHEKVEILNDGKLFTVKIPLIKKR